MLAAVSGWFGFMPSTTLTIPGIAGIILSVGMGVDANIITGERIREELRKGKNLDTALHSGYHRAFSAIFDGNLTGIIVSIVLHSAYRKASGQNSSTALFSGSSAQQRKALSTPSASR